MQRKKPAVRTVKSRAGNARIMKPNFVSPSPSTVSTAKLYSSPRRRDIKTSMGRPNKIIDNLTEKKKKIEFPSLPLLTALKEIKLDSLLQKKCKLCFQMCEFDGTLTNPYVMAKEDILREIHTAILNPKLKISDSKDNYEVIFKLISLHLFQVVPSIPKEWYSPSDFYFQTDNIQEIQWPHLTIIYDIANGFINRPKFDQKATLFLIGDLLKLITYRSRTPDTREQEQIATLFLEIYSKFQDLRKFAFDMIASTLNRIINENEPYTSAKPLLNILASIIPGLKSPLRKYYRRFFNYVILPLHQSPYLSYFAKELFLVATQFLEHSPQLVVEVYFTNVRYWPRLQPQKQLLFLDEIVYCSSFVEEDQIEKALKIIAPQLMISLNTCHAAVAERILSMWEVNDFVWLIVEKPEISYPLFLPKVYECAANHWNVDIKMEATAVLHVMQQNNPMYYGLIGEKFKSLQSQIIWNDLKTGESWKYLLDKFESDKQRKTQQMRILKRIFIGFDQRVIKESKSH